jgi:hypothetical protein
MTDKYKPTYLAWAESYEDEKNEMILLIQGRPADYKLLLREFYNLTGEKYNEKVHQYDDSYQRSEEEQRAVASRIFKKYGLQGRSVRQ